MPPGTRELGIVQTHRHQSVLIVSHKSTNRLLISSLLGFDARGYRDRLDQSPTALTILEFANKVRARLQLFNDISQNQVAPNEKDWVFSHCSARQMRSRTTAKSSRESVGRSRGTSTSSVKLRMSPTWR
nr:histidine phosphatase family protein [Rhabdochromatium marinum]